MKKITIYILQVVFILSISSCEDHLGKRPHDILLDDQVWSDPDLAVSVLANLYSRLQPFSGLEGDWQAPTDTDEAMWSSFPVRQWRNTRKNYAYNFRNLWNYDLVRDVNVFLENVAASTEFTPEEQKQLLAEGRFIRAYVYFLLVRSMGGVPLILHTYEYEGPQAVESMRVPRSAETEVYDFIAAELDEIAGDLGNAGSTTRANKWTALALKSRAMLYAGSIAKYNNLMANPITTPGGEIGIPASRANDYYEKSLAASEKIINEGPYALYNANPDKGKNFYEALTQKASNPEVIWALDYTLDGKYHAFTFDNIPRSLRESPNGSSAITPSLHLVESYDYLDGSSGTLKTRTDDGSDYIYYDNPEDIFANKDARLWGTVVYPGAEFRGTEVSIQAGVLAWDGKGYKIETSNKLGDKYKDGKLMVGEDGPLPSVPFTTNTGFYLRKHVDTRPGSGNRGEGSDIAWIRFRYGEILLNATEAAFELGQEGEALAYINEVRERAGFGPNSISSLTIDKIRNERQVELAFEGHRWWDLKRWRIAHELYNGNVNSPTAMVHALWPYRVVRPGDPQRDGKYVFIKKVAPRFDQPRLFRMGNYYSKIPQGALNANPLLVKNPFH